MALPRQSGKYAKSSSILMIQSFALFFPFLFHLPHYRPESRKKRMKPWWSCIEQVCEFSKNKIKSIFKAWECTECPKEVCLGNCKAIGASYGQPDVSSS